MSCLQNPSLNKNKTPRSSGSGLTMVWAAMLLQGLCQGQPLRLLKPKPCSHQQAPRARKQSELEAASPKTSQGTQAVAKGLPTSLVCVGGSLSAVSVGWRWRGRRCRPKVLKGVWAVLFLPGGCSIFTFNFQVKEQCC